MKYTADYSKWRLLIYWCLYTDNLKLDSMPSQTSPGLDNVHEGPDENNNSQGSINEETAKATPGSTARTLIPGK